MKNKWKGMKWRATGRVQGVGFRPMVFRLAAQHGLAGWVQNTPEGADIVLFATAGETTAFWTDLKNQLPPASIQLAEPEAICAVTPSGFEIRTSVSIDGPRTADILQDLAVCPDCLAEINNPADRRHRYPFINCTQCGPRYSIIEQLPYDRAHTTMKHFAMCPACRAEYDDPRNRRFHAQPNACPDCGPQLAYTDAEGRCPARHEDALRLAEEQLRQGRILAVKGIGGFHLMVDACNATAVEELRRRKQRPHKPLAVMFPSMDAIRDAFQPTPEEEAWLQSPAAPIVLLNARPSAGTTLAANLAPGLSWLGVMLPYAPLHHLLMHDLNRPLVATSGNLSEEPICCDNDEALARLQGIADGFLMHDRPIARPLDDSVVSLAGGHPIMIRRGRGLAPWQLPVPGAPDGLCGLGGQMKNTIALCAGGTATVSAHIGDLEQEASIQLWEQTRQDLSALRHCPVSAVVVDPHPGYTATHEARRMNPPVVEVQHHHAHAAACMADNGFSGPALGVAWDGTGWGPDGTIWGGEFFICRNNEFQRTAFLRPFPLIGGEAAVREPRRAAWGLMEEAGLPPPGDGWAPEERQLMQQARANHGAGLMSSSAGRLFDGVASLLGLCHKATYEGQGAMILEAAAMAFNGHAAPYPFHIEDGIVDWRPMIRALCSDSASAEEKAARFHATLVDIIVAVARKTGLSDVLLSGGCFQNRLLLRVTMDALAAAGFIPHPHREVPPNDAGLSIGQVVAAAARQAASRK